MGFIERLKLEETVKIYHELELAAQKANEREADRQSDIIEQKCHEIRRKAAEAFRNASGVVKVIAELGELLKKSGRGSSSVDRGIIVNFTPEDTDSILDLVEYQLGNQQRVNPREDWLSGPDLVFYFVVETCPDGRIIFHAKESTIIHTENWRGQEREEIFDQALEKAYRGAFLKTI